jgi:prepilin-type processing-associated H-X9-DG protein
MKRVIFPIVLCVVASTACGNQASVDRATCLKQLHTLRAAAMDFEAKHEGRFPKTLDELIAAEKLDPSLLIAPMATDKTKRSYELVPPAERLSKIARPARAVLIRSLYKVGGASYVVFVDGHVELLDSLDREPTP